MKKLIQLLLLCFAALAATSALPGQMVSGDLVGTVKDVSGAGIPNATVVATNVDTKVAYTAQSTGTGEFRISNLPAGGYNIVANASGFSAFTLKNLAVDLNKTSTASLVLPISSATTVEVSAESGVVLDTTSTNLSQTFSNQELSVFPTASVGLGVLNTSLLSPGVASTGGVGIGVGPSVGGQRPRNNNFTVEGIDNNDKAVTGPLLYIPNDAVGSFTLITNQFSPEFGHSSGGQFNTTVLSGTNRFHGRGYEYFQNRNLNAQSGIAGGKTPNARYDFNRYGGQLGGPIFKDKLFFFGNFERQTTGQNLNNFLCTPTAAGKSTLSSISASGFSATNLAQYLKYVPAANYLGGVQVNDATDNSCGNQASGPQFLTVTNAAGTATNIPLGNYLVNTATFSNFDALTTSMDYTLTSKDSIRARYLYNTQGSQDTSASLPVFFTTQPYKYHLISFSEFHSFTPNLSNEVRIGYNRYANTLTAGNFSYPGLDVFPNVTIGDQNSLNIGPDGNAPQFTIQNLYQLTDNVSYSKGAHTFKMGFDGRKYISPQGFTQRSRGDYQYTGLDVFLHDLSPDNFGERSTGNHTYYGDQTALYGYFNDTWRALPTITINAGMRYEFTAVPVGERAQALNAVASVPGLVDFHAPKPGYTNFAPRFGVNYAPDGKTSVRAAFGVAYDVLFDNLGTLSFPPQFSSTNDVNLNTSTPNFLGSGGLPPGTGSGTVTLSPAAARAATSAYLPDQASPYAETYTLTIQRTIGTAYTAEIGYVGTRGIHLATQDQINIQPRVTAANQLPTIFNAIPGDSSSTNTLASIKALSNIVPAYLAAGFTSKITSYQPYSSSNYNGMVVNLTRRFQKGLQLNLSYTWSKTMDDATDEVFATVLTPRREQNSQCIACDYSRSALDRSHRVTLEAYYDLPFYKNRGFLLRNLVGNWAISPIYTYESPEYATALSGVNSNLNGDSATAIDRPLINPNGVKGTGFGVVPFVNPALQSKCGGTPTYNAANGNGTGLYTACSADIVGYAAGSLVPGSDPVSGSPYPFLNRFTPSNPYYVQAGQGTLPNAARNTLPIRPIDNVDVSAFKAITLKEHYGVEFGVQAFNVLNHAQYIPGTIDNVNSTSYTSSYNYQTVTSSFFNQPQKQFLNNSRNVQLSGKFIF